MVLQFLYIHINSAMCHILGTMWHVPGIMWHFPGTIWQHPGTMWHLHGTMWKKFIFLIVVTVCICMDSLKLSWVWNGLDSLKWNETHINSCHQELATVFSISNRQYFNCKSSGSSKFARGKLTLSAHSFYFCLDTHIRAQMFCSSLNVNFLLTYFSRFV